MVTEESIINVLTGVGFAMMIFGSFNNFLCHRVILRMPHQGLITLLFSNLAIFDTIALIHSFFTLIGSQVLSNFFDFSFMGQFGCGCLYYTFNVSMTSAVLYLTSLSIIRCLTMTFPVFMHSLTPRKLRQFVSACCIVLHLRLCSPALVVHGYIPELNNCEAVIDKNSWTTHFFFLFYVIPFYFISFLVIIGSNIMFIVSIQRREKRKISLLTTYTAKVNTPEQAQGNLEHATETVFTPPEHDDGVAQVWVETYPVEQEFQQPCCRYSINPGNQNYVETKRNRDAMCSSDEQVVCGTDRDAITVIKGTGNVLYIE